MELDEKKKALREVIDNLTERDIIEIGVTTSIRDTYTSRNYNLNIVKEGKMVEIPIEDNFGDMFDDME